MNNEILSSWELNASRWIDVIDKSKIESRRFTNKAIGKIFIQTIHPFFLLKNNLEFKSQWLEDSWKGLDGGFENGHKWYLRTFTDWLTTIHQSEFQLLELQEPTNLENLPVSLFLVLR